MALIGSEVAGEEGWPPRAKQEGGAAVKRYDVTVNGVQTTLLLSDADAKARGLTVEAKQAQPPANKARGAATKHASAADKKP